MRLPMFCALLSLAGCGTLDAYPGGPRDPDASALVQAGHHEHARVVLSRVNGRDLGLLDERARVAPGPQRVEVLVVFERAARRRVSHEVVEFEALAGHDYTVHADWYVHGPRLRVTDDRGQIVAEAVTRVRKLPDVGAR